jgi:putative heme transporter
MESKSPLIPPRSSHHENEPMGAPSRVELPWPTVAKAILVLVGAGFVARLFGLLLPVLVMFLEALLLTAALTPPVRWCMQRGLPRGGAVAVVLGGLMLVVTGAAALLGPPLVAESRSLAAALPGYVNDLQGILSRFPSLNKQLQNGANTGSTDPGAMAPVFLTAGGGVLSGVTDTIAVIVLAAYLLAGGERSLAYAMHFLPQRFQNRIHGAVPGVVHVVSGYVFGQGSSAISVKRSPSPQLVGDHLRAAALLLDGFT